MSLRAPFPLSSVSPEGLNGLCRLPLAPRGGGFPASDIPYGGNKRAKFHFIFSGGFVSCPGAGVGERPHVSASLLLPSSVGVAWSQSHKHSRERLKPEAWKALVQGAGLESPLALASQSALVPRWSVPGPALRASPRPASS